MAKAPKRTTNPDPKPLQSTPDDWIPLTAAFLQIQQVVGGEQLAEEDLRLRLVSGEVSAQDRLVTPGGGIEIIPLAPEDFEDGLLFPRVPDLDGDDVNFLLRVAHRHTNLLRRVEMLRLHGHNFFLRRVDLQRVWPIAGEAKKRREAALPTTRPKDVGRKVWLAADKVWELWGEGYRWPDREQLLRKVRIRIGDDGLSLRTLDKALAYLKRKRLIDRGLRTRHVRKVANLCRCL
jgi:hypothetical protein